MRFSKSLVNKWKKKSIYQCSFKKIFNPFRNTWMKVGAPNLAKLVLLISDFPNLKQACWTLKQGKILVLKRNLYDCRFFWTWNTRLLYFEEKKEKIATYQLWLQKEIYMIVDFITVSIKLQVPIYVGKLCR